jgi:hypothetical protein
MNKSILLGLLLIPCLSNAMEKKSVEKAQTDTDVVMEYRNLSHKYGKEARIEQEDSNEAIIYKKRLTNRSLFWARQLKQDALYDAMVILGGIIRTPLHKKSLYEALEADFKKQQEEDEKRTNNK